MKGGIHSDLADTLGKSEATVSAAAESCERPSERFLDRSGPQVVTLLPTQAVPPNRLISALA